MEPIRKEDFMCDCTGAGKIRCAEVRHSLKTDTNFGVATAAVYALQWGLENRCRGHITSIYCDMWSGISAEIYQWPPEPPDDLSDDELDKWDEDHQDQLVGKIYVQCDKIEDGMARVVQLAEEIAEEVGNKEEDK